VSAVVHTGAGGRREYITYVPTFPEFIQLLDDDIVCLSALTLVINARCREDGSYDEIITQLTLSLYLMTRCQLKLRHSVTSLAQTLDDIAVAWRRQNVQWTLNQLTLTLCERKLIAVIYHNLKQTVARQCCNC